MAREIIITEWTLTDKEYFTAHSPKVLPPNPSQRGWTSTQIQKTMYEALFYLYDKAALLQSEIKTAFNTSTLDINDLLSYFTTGKANYAIADKNGDDITTTYAKITDLNAYQLLLVSGTTIKTINNQSILGSGNLWVSGSFGGLTGQVTDNQTLVDYINANGGKIDKIYVNNVEQTITNKGVYLEIFDGDYNNLSNKPTLFSGDYDDLSNKPTIPSSASDVNALPDTTKYGASLEMSMDNTTYIITLKMKDQDGNYIGTTQTIDLPLENVVVSGRYDDTTKKVVLTLKDGSTIEFSVADLISGLQSTIDSTHKLASDLVDDANQTHKFVTSGEKTNIADNTSARHTHNNKALLDTYTQTETNLADAVIKKHSHSNISVLNNLTQAVINNSHTHSNKSVLDTITQALINTWNNKQNAISDLSTIRSGASAGATALQPSDVVALTNAEIDAIWEAN